MKYQLLSLFLMVALVAGDEEVLRPGEISQAPTIDDKDLNDTVLHYPTRLDDQLYHDIAVENYAHALTLVKDFISRGRSNEMKKPIDQLVEHRRSNLAAFAYKLFAAGHKKVVEDLFPAPYKMVFTDSVIKFVNNRYKLPIEFSRFEDSDGDTNVYGVEENANNNNYAWKLEPVEDGNSVYFKIRHHSNTRYLKLGTSMDGDGDYTAYGSTNSDTKRHQWMFQPVSYDGKVTFCVINREHYQALKFANSIHQGNRRLYSTSGDFYNYPERYGWQIDAITSSQLHNL